MARTKLIRGVWKPVDGGVRQTAVTSRDEGKTWEPWFRSDVPAACRSAVDVRGSEGRCGARHSNIRLL